MSGLNKYAIFKEFPFLSRYCDTNVVKDACVQRFDEEVLEKRGSGNSYSYVTAGYLLNERGNLIVQVGHELEFNLFDRMTWVQSSGKRMVYDTIGDTLHRIGPMAMRVHYVVYIDARVLTLYKPPQGHPSIGKWLSSRSAEIISKT